MLTTVRLYGTLGKKFGRVHRYHLSTPAEALRAVQAHHPGFLREMSKFPRMRIVVDDTPVPAVQELGLKRTMRTVRVVPVPEGAGFEVGLATLLFMNTSMSLVTASIVAAVVTTAITSVVTSLIIGGISSLLFSPPDSVAAEEREAPDNKPSYAFSGAVNTVVQGHAIPVFYGRLKVGSQVLSVGLTTEEIPV